MKAPLPITPRRRAVQQARPPRIARAGLCSSTGRVATGAGRIRCPLGRPPQNFMLQESITFCPRRHARALTRIKVVVRDRSPETPEKGAPPQRPGPRPSLGSGLLAPHRVTHSPPAISRALRAGKPELFVQCLATHSYRHGSGKEKKVLTYSDLANTAQESETFQFLADILPKKILASKYLKMLKEEKREEDEENDNDNESDHDEAES
ncbi:PREDICTED: uncharacterized protein LOC105509129 [Colobus angolensis palliatus]|uniref:uncharacterized protein LOC105509129 n=1 Tax=Colobus angolensis palliatus TaxID=336983 RepID=UPI0005F3E324|nr:PREDICTED: uncharacterized protein LOC105509129 [Colobus angolensis palliatus]